MKPLDANQSWHRDMSVNAEVETVCRVIEGQPVECYNFFQDKTRFDYFSYKSDKM